MSEQKVITGKEVADTLKELRDNHVKKADYEALKAEYDEFRISAMKGFDLEQKQDKTIKEYAAVLKDPRNVSILDKMEAAVKINEYTHTYGEGETVSLEEAKQNFAVLKKSVEAGLKAREEGGDGDAICYAGIKALL